MPPLNDAFAAIGRRGWDALRRTQPTNLRSVATAAGNCPGASSSGASLIGANANCNHLTHHSIFENAQSTTLRYISSSPPSSQPSNITTNLTTGDEESNKSIFSKLWDKYSFEGQKKRIVLGERLFRTAWYQANDP